MNMEMILTAPELPDGTVEDMVIFKEKAHLQVVKSILKSKNVGPLTASKWSMKKKGDLPFNKGFILHAPCSRGTLFTVLEEASKAQNLNFVLTADGTTNIDVRSHHKTKRLKFGSMEADVDLPIAPLILRLWKNGIWTCQSCEENEPGVVWIQFPEHEDAKRFFDAVSLHAHWISWNKNYVHIGNSDPDGEGCFSVRFSQDDIPIILKQFPAKAPI